MTDNVVVNPNGSTPIATDDVGGVQYQRVKVNFGDDGAATDVSDSNPLPVGGGAFGTLTDAKVTDPDNTSANLLQIARGQLQKIIDATYSAGVKPSSTSLCVAPSSDGQFGVISGVTGYQAVAASASQTPLGNSGAAGDYFEDILAVVSTAATSIVTIYDGSTPIVVHPNNVGSGVGTYPIPIGLKSTNGGWKISTGAGVAVVCKGDFS